MASKVVSFGEILFDVYPEGKKLGGAPFNVAAHLSLLGNDSSIISRIGEDGNGSEILAGITKYKIAMDTIQMDKSLPTGLVNVQLDDQGKPTYVIEKPSSWDNIACIKSDLELVATSDALVFGSLACRSPKSRATLLKLADHSHLNICDLNIRQDFYDKKLISILLELTHVLKINDEEASLLQDMFGLPQEGFHKALGDKYGISVIVETRGADGAVAYSGGRTAQAEAEKIEVVDTVGSGDAFLAGFIHRFLRHAELDTCLKHGCRLGAFVATKPGAVPDHG